MTTDLEAVGEVDRDAEAILAALDDVGVDATLISWRDPDARWDDHDLVVIRSPWDYPEHLGEFLDWMARVAAQVPILNCPATIRWNLDKSYLAQFVAAGLPIVPTTFCDSHGEVVEALAKTSSGRVVVKPNVSIGSRDSGLFTSGDPSATELATTILASGRRVLVQPAIDRVAEIGEHGLVCFDGVFSHAFTKGPILQLGGGFLGGRYTENITPAQASDAEIALAEAASACIAGLVDHTGCGPGCDAPPLYARYDIVMGDDGPLLLEAEVFEPAYFLEVAPGAARRFATAVRSRLD